MTFSYTQENKEHITIFHFEGELIEKFQAKDLLEQIDDLLKLDEQKIILDLKNIKYMNSSGLSVLINIFTKVRNANGELIISELSSKVKELMLVSKLNTIFTVKETMEDALADFNLKDK